ncbi:unnamed protein product [Meloidogyne enterolobii]|uniref:Uncharacterized protein n=1 Tax=Meloidogyne enterolobii TaxID=390850 RepID=A0ACB0XYP2_MELEN
MIAVSEICLRKILIKLKMPKEKRKRNNLLKSLIFIKLILINSIFGISDGAIKLNIMCKDLFTCTVKNRCVQLDSLQSSFENATIGKNLYNELDKNIDYGCIFTSGCMEECNKCPLCMTSKQQVCGKYQAYFCPYSRKSGIYLFVGRILDIFIKVCYLYIYYIIHVVHIFKFREIFIPKR